LVRQLSVPQPIDDDPSRGADRRPDAATVVIAALRESTPHGTEGPIPPNATSAAPPLPAPEPQVEIPLRTPQPRPERRRTPRERQQRSDATYAARSTNVVFTPRTGIRRTLSLLLLVMVAATAVSGFLAYVDRGESALLAAGAMTALTLVTWGARAAAVPVTLAIRHGHLHVVRAGHTEVADIAQSRIE
jgi:hypothetical protein